MLFRSLKHLIDDIIKSDPIKYIKILIPQNKKYPDKNVNYTIPNPNIILFVLFKRLFLSLTIRLNALRLKKQPIPDIIVSKSASIHVSPLQSNIVAILIYF